MINPYKLNISNYSSHELILNCIGHNKTVLDLGCNDGYIGLSSNKTNYFYGLDRSKESISKAKKTYIDAIVYDLNILKRLPWEKKFDVLLFADVLEHLVDPEKTLLFFTNKYLKIHGHVILALPNIANWQIRLKLMIGKFDYTEIGILDKTHLHFYTFKTAKELASFANLKIISEFGGSSTFGGMIKKLPFLKGLLSNNIILLCRK